MQPITYIQPVAGCKHTPALPHSEAFLWKFLAQFFSTGHPAWYAACRGHTTAAQLEEQMHKKSAVPMTAWFNVYSPRNPNKFCFPTAGFPRGEYHIIYLGATLFFFFFF